jgi:ribulose-phosphate 3-epimerase
MAIIAPSLLAADFLELGKACSMLNASEAEWFHLDVMDGVFVPNISYGLPIIEQIKKTTNKEMDVHLMIVQPEKYIAAFKQAGATILTVHYEACAHLHSTLQLIKAQGMKAGVALNPHTPIDVLKDIIFDIDVVCIMSVNPGFGGQKFIEHSYEKVKAL